MKGNTMGIIKRKGSRNRYRRFTVVLALGAALVASVSLVAGAFAGAYVNNVSYSGQGLTADGFGGYDLNSEICDGNPNGVLENGADAEGPYLLFVLTATGAKNADITINGTTYPMVKSGNGTFKYVSAWIDPDTVKTSGYVTASYDGKAKNAQLTISHGCRPFTKQNAWCSPGFWRNSDDAAWALTGYTRSNGFNSDPSAIPPYTGVEPAFYGAQLAGNPTLNTVLTTSGGTYKGPDLAGTDPRTQALPLSPFNATGAFLTDHIPGYQFDPSLLAAEENGSDTCPIDNHGNFKVPQ
jgi:hypothetical protein